MKYSDRFAGHLDHLDPRTPVHGAAGCVWPTVPAMRYYLTSDDATGIFLPLNVSGILVMRMVTSVDHDDYRYVQFGPFPVISCPWFRKRKDPESTGYIWDIIINGSSGCGPDLVWEIHRPMETCNRTIEIGNKCCPLLPGSCTGSTFRAEQVEHDAFQPPA